MMRAKGLARRSERSAGGRAVRGDRIQFRRKRSHRTTGHPHSIGTCRGPEAGV